MIVRKGKGKHFLQRTFALSWLFVGLRVDGRTRSGRGGEDRRDGFGESSG